MTADLPGRRPAGPPTCRAADLPGQALGADKNAFGGLATKGMPVIVDPIGQVASSRTAPVDDDWDSVTATISLDHTRFTPDALSGLGEFSHIEVVYVFDRVDPHTVQTAARHPRDNPSWPKVGIFAQRAKMRPNRLGVSICRLVRSQASPSPCRASMRSTAVPSSTSSLTSPSSGHGVTSGNPSGRTN